jgi:Domain of unknown function (DUF4417)
MGKTQSNLANLWNTPGDTMSLGCHSCPDRAHCGGQTQSGGFDCLEHCCQRPEKCNIVCPNSLAYVNRYREIRGFALDIPVAPKVEPPRLPSFVPLIYHGSARNDVLSVPAVALKLYRFARRNGDCPFASRLEVDREFKLGGQTRIILSGVADDDEVERWWDLETRVRIQAIQNLRHAGVSMATTPNCSMIANRPRHDDLHSIKRIGQMFHEFVSEGVPTALHVNGRAEHDFARWAEFIVKHPEVTHIAYEFTTGTAHLQRMIQHRDWLCQLARSVGRRLGLVVRGGSRILPELRRSFDVTLIGASAFSMAVKRHRAEIQPNGGIKGVSNPLPEGHPIDALLASNVESFNRWIESLSDEFAIAA